MFSKNQFIEDCIRAVAEGKEAVREVVAEAVSDTKKSYLSLASKNMLAYVHCTDRLISP